jgi:hypothetical protein
MHVTFEHDMLHGKRKTWILCHSILCYVVDAGSGLVDATWYFLILLLITLLFQVVVTLLQHMHTRMVRLCLV